MIPGTPLTQMCFLTKGYADVYMKDVLIDTLTAGDSFGEPVRARAAARPRPEVVPAAAGLGVAARSQRS